ncbi:hypothetical protein GTO27_01090 [Candidatus Bathyarchaeota archaeon]|nr:hypothetical protein [Candidatus Bathyarchaeota archaeon]
MRRVESTVAIILIASIIVSMPTLLTVTIVYPHNDISHQHSVDDEFT